MANKAKILLIEDELPIRRFLKAGLPEEHYQLIEAATGQEGIHLAATHNPNLILLDLGLPDTDGLEVIGRIREWSSVPIIVLSARGEEQDKIVALDNGANDYLTKPFSIGELLARVRVALRPSASVADGKNELAFGPIRVDLSAHLVFCDGKEIHLTPLEYKLLTTLMKSAGKVLTHRQLMAEVWGPAYAAETHYLRIFMKQLRHKLEQDPAQPKFLTTEPGVGYRFKVTDDPGA